MKDTKKLNLKSIEMDNQYFKINFSSHEFLEIMKLKTKCYRTRGSQFLDLKYTVLNSDQCQLQIKLLFLLSRI